ncbi:pentapeptide repeat-containing protein [Haloquadratum walsbyi]|uniref:Pentapeptide repeats (8 copies) n=1 Tax=Haloquadratum walsbyi J07HQW2 TaxID=1238425 RepID=U1PJE8_9EURY|nr:pentapeptide repeat-containing protein [Haloquadratum walsbyi]ERG93787.1 MAG: Pentapeptide repeats (8 copies) [Haloquadratum walsbyi J07HQW2]
MPHDEDEFSIPNSNKVSPTDIQPNADLTGANLSNISFSDTNLSTRIQAMH